jgi:hypothetical protein
MVAAMDWAACLCRDGALGGGAGTMLLFVSQQAVAGAVQHTSRSHRSIPQGCSQ